MIDFLELYRKKRTDFGIQANLPEILDLAKSVPIPIPYESSGFVTFNNYGVDRTLSGKNPDSWLIDEFLRPLHELRKPILDLGTGFGGTTISALEKGATVISNDLDEKHLLFSVSRLLGSPFLDRLYLVPGAFPIDTDFPPNSIDCVFSYRMLHYLGGDSIEIGVQKMFEWLSPGGRVFLAVAAPDSFYYSEWVRPIYNKKWSEGNVWPGDGIPVGKAFQKAKDINPSLIHLLDEKPLRRVFEAHGFSVERADYLPTEAVLKDKRVIDEKALFGLVALKTK